MNSKTAALTNRKGLPKKYKANDLIIDDELQRHNSAPKIERYQRQIESMKVQNWFVAEYFYCQADRAYFWRYSFNYIL